MQFNEQIFIPFLTAWAHFEFYTVKQLLFAAPIRLFGNIVYRENIELGEQIYSLRENVF